jgi:hypothetical protein
MKDYTKNLTNKYINELNSNELYDDEIKNEFSNKLKNKINEDLDNFNKENESILEQKFNQDLDILSDKIINDIKQNNNNTNLNFHSFFQELDLFKEKANKLSPNFAHKNDIILDKAILLAKKFIDDANSNSNKINENELNELKNENIKQKLKISEYKQKIRNLNMKNDINIENLNNEYLTMKLNLQKIEDKLNIVRRAKERQDEIYQKNINDLIENYEKEIKKINDKNNEKNIEINMKNEQLNIIKSNNEKIIELNEKKFRYYENEIKMLKEKIEQLLNISKSSCRNEEKISKNNNKPSRNIENNDLINNSITKLMSAVNDHIKEQNEDNQTILNKLMQEKEIEFKNDKKLIKKLSEIKNKNNELETKLKKTNYTIQKMEEKIDELLPYEDLINNINNFKCNKCEKYFTLPEYKLHKDNCPLSDSSQNKININYKLNPDKLKIRILKGKIKHGNSSSPYLEYIVDVNYNNMQQWRLGKKFKDFINLYNIINTEYKEFIKIPISNIFIDIKNTGNVGSFHENKIRQLELFMNDIINLDMINRSKAFSKFIEFDKYFDEENELLMTMSSRYKLNPKENEYKDKNNKKYSDIDDNYEEEK